jgi:Tfp pilus assembly PilM family ATPase
MNIVTRSSDELVLKEGGAGGMVVGIVFVVAGVLAGIFLRQSNPIVMWIALAVVLIGIATILFSSSITVVVNKTSGSVLYQKKRLAGAKNSTYAIADIFRIETRKQWRVENTPPSGNQIASPPQPVLVAQSLIVFIDGSELALDHRKTSSTTSVGSVVLVEGQGAESAIAAEVAQFLNVPFEEIDPPNIGPGINIQIRP